MAKVEAKNSVQGVRSFLEGLAEAGNGHIEGSTNKIKVQVRADVLDDRMTGKQGSTKVTLVYHASTGNITLQSPAAIEDGMYGSLKVLEALYAVALKNDQVPPPPPGGTKVVNSFRLPAWDDFSAIYETGGSVRRPADAEKENAGPRPARTLRLPRESEFLNGVGDVGLAVCENMADYPTWRDKVLRCLVMECGLQPEMLDADHPERWTETGLFDGAPAISTLGSQSGATDTMSMGSGVAPTS